MNSIKSIRIVGRRKLLTLSGAGLLLAAALGAQNAPVTAHDAWVRVPLPSKSETALYMVLENSGAQKRSVVSASSDAAAKVEMHEMKMAGNMGGMGKADPMAKMESMGKPDPGMMTMTPLKEIAIPAKGKTALAPDGIHMMMFGLKSRPAAGDRITVTLKLDDGTMVPVTAVVRK